MTTFSPSLISSQRLGDASVIWFLSTADDLRWVRHKLLLRLSGKTRGGAAGTLSSEPTLWKLYFFFFKRKDQWAIQLSTDYCIYSTLLFLSAGHKLNLLLRYWFCYLTGSWPAQEILYLWKFKLFAAYKICLTAWFCLNSAGYIWAG